MILVAHQHTNTKLNAPTNKYIDMDQSKSKTVPLRLEVNKLFSCSTQLCMVFKLVIKLKCRKLKAFLAFKLSDVVFIKPINVKLPTIVGILALNSMLNYAQLSGVCNFYNLDAR